MLFVVLTKTYFNVRDAAIEKITLTDCSNVDVVFAQAAQKQEVLEL
jgi:hypothetical protein